MQIIWRFGTSGVATSASEFTPEFTRYLSPWYCQYFNQLISFFSEISIPNHRFDAPEFIENQILSCICNVSNYFCRCCYLSIVPCRVAHALPQHHRGGLRHLLLLPPHGQHGGLPGSRPSGQPIPSRGWAQSRGQSRCYALFRERNQPHLPGCWSHSPRHELPR